MFLNVLFKYIQVPVPRAGGLDGGQHFRTGALHREDPNGGFLNRGLLMRRRSRNFERKVGKMRQGSLGGA